MNFSLGGGLRSLARRMPLLDAERAGVELYGAPRLASFTLFNPNEVALSRVIGELLDPRGSHGQGPLFLNALLRSLQLQDVRVGDDVSVDLEVSTAKGRRIDIVIRTPDVLLGVENKPWSFELNDQLKDYAAEIERLKPGKASLIFLSDKKPSETNFEGCAKCNHISYSAGSKNPSLHAILSSTLQSIRAQRCRIFIEDFLKYIDGHFGEGLMADETSEIYVKAAVEEFLRHGSGEGMRKAVAAILLCPDEFRKSVINEIGDAVLHELGGDFKAEGHSLADCLSKKWFAWKLAKLSWPKNCFIAIESDTGNFNGIFSGVHAPDGDHDNVRTEGHGGCELHSELRIHLGDRSSTEWWPHRKFADTSNWDTKFVARLTLASPSGKVGDAPEVLRLTSWLKAISQRVDCIISDPRLLSDKAAAASAPP